MDLAERGVHPPEQMPFCVPWTDAPPGELARNTAAHHWRSRADFSVTSWHLPLGVWYDGELVGCQGLRTRDFPSLAVSRKVGYREDGRERLLRRPDEVAVNLRLVLTPETFVPGEQPLAVEGLAAFRRFVGLDADPLR